MNSRPPHRGRAAPSRRRLPSKADDWPMLGGHPDRNLVSAEKGLPRSSRPRNRRRTSSGSPISARRPTALPRVSGGRVFVGTNNDEPARPGAQGRQGRPHVLLGGGRQVPLAGGPRQAGDRRAEDAAFIGVCSTPSVVGDRVYYVSNRAELICASAAGRQGPSGRSTMRKELGVSPHQGSASSPLVVGDLVYVVTGQGTDFKKHKVMNPKAPELHRRGPRPPGRWSGRTARRARSIFQGQWGSPAYGVVDGKPQVALPGRRRLALLVRAPDRKAALEVQLQGAREARSPTARRKRRTSSSPSARLSPATGCSSRPGIDTDTDGPGCLRAIDARKSGDVTATRGALEAGRATSSAAASPPSRSTRVSSTRCSSTGMFDCIDLETGKRIWQHDMLSTAWGSPLVADGKVYVRNGDGEVLVLPAGREKKLLVEECRPAGARERLGGGRQRRDLHARPEQTVRASPRPSEPKGRFFHEQASARPRAVRSPSAAPRSAATTGPSGAAPRSTAPPIRPACPRSGRTPRT